jgi:hypothetical protein
MRSFCASQLAAGEQRPCDALFIGIDPSSHVPRTLHFLPRPCAPCLYCTPFKGETWMPESCKHGWSSQWVGWESGN